MPGTNVRTGRPGAFSKSGSEFRVDDNKVRYYVAPPMGLLDKTDVSPMVTWGRRGVTNGVLWRFAENELRWA